ncbi:hypothetical protein J7384_16605 [Endozoicomonas sp. G2_1]|uniref:hypothetical protein n=1 Tax=Endozoicomonas sp. G2_1 TaxID=2821091 RepID=UPI001AD9B632|nr:hypothetical protein [Endozoicomonas sp. G2_1]MBO9491983.1 hypothetical protein [Endozoicomonas sp. G2_1]
MEKLISLSWTAFTIFIGALFFGLRDFDKSISDLDFNVYLYVVFIFLLRFKIALDDNFYFSITEMQRWQSLCGLAIALLTWFLFVFAGYYLSTFSDSIFLLLWSLALSTFWILVIAIGDGFYSEQKVWLATNTCYITGLSTLLWLPSLSEVSETSQHQVALTTIDVATSFVLTVLIVITIIDFKYSKSIQNAKY